MTIDLVGCCKSDLGQGSTWYLAPYMSMLTGAHDNLGALGYQCEFGPYA